MSDYEVVINLWYYITPTGAIYELAGRAYVARGTDQDKTILLKQLALSDYHIAKKFSVPDNFKVILGGGEEKRALSHVSVLNTSGLLLFECVMTALDYEIPENIIVGPNNKSVKYKLAIPTNPLYVMTAILNDGEGNLTPVVKSRRS